MKILMVQPKKPEKAVGGEDVMVFEPLSLEYIASGIVQNHDVKILDMRIEDNLDSVLHSFQPDVVGITAYTVHVNVVKQLFENIKKHNPEVFTVVGGHHATIVPEDFLVPAIDLVVLGEGVFVFKEVIERLEQKKDLDGIAGTAFSKNGKAIINEKAPIDDLDLFPFPARDLTKKYRNYYFSEWMKPLASIRTSKGCKFRCNFCALWKMTDGKYLTRKPERIVEELSKIEEEYVFFADDESLLDVDRMKELADLIEKAGIKKRYFLYGRSDTISKHPELIKKWKEIGLERVFVGVEFFRDEDLKSIHKGSSIKKNIDAINILKSYEVDIYPSFMVKQDFDKNDFREFREYCLSLDLEFLAFSVLTPLPGTDFYEEVKEKLLTNNYDYFDFFHTLLPTSLPLDEFYKEYTNLYTKTRSFLNQIASLKKYPIREIPSLFRKYSKFTKQLKNLHNDYTD